MKNGNNLNCLAIMSLWYDYKHFFLFMRKEDEKWKYNGGGGSCMIKNSKPISALKNKNHPYNIFLKEPYVAYWGTAWG